MADFDLAYAPVAKWEGGWTHDSGDKGGETFRGCARNFFPNEPIWPVIDREKSHPSYKKGKAAFSAHLMGIPSLTGCVKVGTGKSGGTSSGSNGSTRSWPTSCSSRP